MNKEIIAEYKEVFDWWVKSGSIWVKYKYADESTNWIKRTSCNDLDIHWDKVYYNGKQEICYVQNDEYAELRKHLVDGKHIIYKFGTWEDNTDRWCTLKCSPTSMTNGNDFWDFEWKFADDIAYNLIAVRDGEYRIKPENPKFKVGDWVNSREYKIIRLTSENVNSYNKFPNDVNSPTYTKLWEPQEGEWVIVWKNKWIDNYQIKRYSNSINYTNIAPLEFIQTLKTKS